MAFSALFLASKIEDEIVSIQDLVEVNAEVVYCFRLWSRIEGLRCSGLVKNTQRSLDSRPVCSCWQSHHVHNSNECH